MAGFQPDLFAPKTTWQAPSLSGLPDLRNEKLVAFDTETYDPNLLDMGPGFIRGDAHVLGVSVAVPGFACYIPLNHYDGNVTDKDLAVKWLQNTLGGSGKKLGANIHYDLDAVRTLGVTLGGDYYDVQTVESIIDEGLPSYSLEAVAQKRLGVGKDTAHLDAVLGSGRNRMQNLRWVSAGDCATYAVQDAALLIDIEVSQRADVDSYDLVQAVDREVDLTHALWDMHQRGVRIDVEQAHRTSEEWALRAKQSLDEAYRLYGSRLNPDSSKSLAIVLADRGFRVPRTDKGNPSVSNEYLRSCDDPVLSAIYEYRRLNKIRRDFIDGLFLRYNINGRLHPQWFQSRHTREGAADGEVGGAETGRITGSKPNLTQVPSRDKELGPITRALVLPEEGAIWCKGDFSSQEPRWITHFAYLAKCDGAAELRQRYIEDRHLDMHMWARDLIAEKTGVELERRPVKNINLGLAYGMGKPLLASKIGMSLDDAKGLFAAYHAAIPFMGQIADKASKRAQELGLIRTWGGRLRRFELWESTEWDQKGLFKSREACVQQWGSARRAKTHKALNSAVQGTAADQIKQAIVDLWRSGDLPLLQVYDEIGFSVGTHKEGYILCEIMEEALKGEVPALVEPEFGPSWGECKKP